MGVQYLSSDVRGRGRGSPFLRMWGPQGTQLWGPPQGNTLRNPQEIDHGEHGMP